MEGSLTTNINILSSTAPVLVCDSVTLISVCMMTTMTTTTMMMMICVTLSLRSDDILATYDADLDVVN